MFIGNKPGGKSTDFKTGLKKLMVLPRSTTVSELLLQAQRKLQMKKPPVRAFLIVEATSRSAPQFGRSHGWFGSTCDK
jgi:hypothetical protein